MPPRRLPPLYSTAAAPGVATAMSEDEYQPPEEEQPAEDYPWADGNTPAPGTTWYNPDYNPGTGEFTPSAPEPAPAPSPVDSVPLPSAPSWNTSPQWNPATGNYNLQPGDFGYQGPGTTYNPSQPAGQTAPPPSTSSPSGGSTQPSSQTQPPVTPPTTAKPRVVTGKDGKPYTLTMTDEDYNLYQQDLKAWADAEKQAREFAQGIEQQKVDLQRALQEWQKAYQQSLLQYNDRSLAQQTAYQALQADLQKQALELQKIQQQAQQNQQAAMVSLEREKLDAQRKQTRTRRRLPQIRYR